MKITVETIVNAPIEDVWRKVLEQVPYGDGALIVLCSLDGEGVRRKSGDPLVEKFFNDRPQLSSGGTGANATNSIPERVSRMFDLD